MKSQEPSREDVATSVPSIWIDHVSSTIRKPRQEIRQYESHMLSTLRCRDEDNHKSRQSRKVTIHDVTIYAPIRMQARHMSWICGKTNIHLLSNELDKTNQTNRRIATDKSNREASGIITTAQPSRSIRDNYQLHSASPGRNHCSSANSQLTRT